MQRFIVLQRIVFTGIGKIKPKSVLKKLPEELNAFPPVLYRATYMKNVKAVPITELRKKYLMQDNHFRNLRERVDFIEVVAYGIRYALYTPVLKAILSVIEEQEQIKPELKFVKLEVCKQI